MSEDMLLGPVASLAASAESIRERWENEWHVVEAFVVCVTHPGEWESTELAWELHELHSNCDDIYYAPAP